MGCGIEPRKIDIAGAEGSHLLEGNMCGTVCEVLTPCRGQRPHHVQRDRIGTWEARVWPSDVAWRDGPHREGEEPKPMMHGHEKSDLVIVAVKPTNKARKAPCGGVCRGGRSGVGGAKGGGQGEYAPAKHVLDSEPGSRVTGAGADTATCAVTHPRQEPYAGKPHVRIWAGGVP